MTGNRPGRNLLIERLFVKWTRPMTMPQMMKATCLTNATIWRYVKRMLDAQPREAHIVRWTHPKRGPQTFVPVYKRGDGLDAPRPEEKSVAQRSRDYRERQSGGEREDRLARKRARHWASKPARRDHTVAALFGGANANG